MRLVRTALLLLGLFSTTYAAAPSIEWTTDEGPGSDPFGGPINPSMVSSGQAYMIRARGVDSDGNLAAVSIDKNNSPFAYAGGGNGTTGISNNGTSDGSGSATFTAWATDSNGNSSGPISWTVTVNAAPTIEWTTDSGPGADPFGGPINPSTVDGGQTYMIRARGYDANRNLAAVSINKDGAPFAYAGGGDGTQGISNNTASGSSTFTAWATDSTGATSGTISWTVTALVNNSPQTVSASASSATAGSSMTFTGRATDPDGNLTWIHFYVTGPGYPGWNHIGSAQASGGDATRTLNWTPSQKGDYAVHIRAQDAWNWYDGNANVVTNFSVSGRPPTGTIRANTTSIQAGQTVVISVDGTDPDGDLRYINIDQTSPTNGHYGPGDTGTHTPPNNGGYNLGGYFASRTRDLTLTLGVAGTYVFRGAMNDDSGWYYTPNTVTVSVAAPPNTPPTAPTDLRASNITNSGFALAWNASTDNEGGVTGYRMYINGNDVGMTSVPSFQFGQLQPNHNYTAGVQAVDGSGLQSTYVSLNIRTLDGPAVPHADESLWLDVDGDGIRDEIYHPGTARFNYFANNWWSEQETYWSYGINIGFFMGSAPFTYYQPPSWNGIDNPPDSPPSLQTHGGAQYGWTWSPEWYVRFHPLKTYIDMQFDVVLETGYDYIFQRNRGNGWESMPGFTSGIMQNVGGGLHSIPFGSWDADDLFGSTFRLIRLGKPMGGVNVKNAVGALLGSITNGGTFGITISQQATTILSAVDLIGRALAGGPQTVWQIRDVVTGIVRRPWGSADSIDVGSLGSGTYTINVLQDNRTGLDGHTPAIFSVTFVIGDGPTIAFIKDGQGDRNVDQSDPLINFARVGHWGADSGLGLDGFDSNGVPLRVSAFGNDFIEKDPERFYIRINDPQANPSNGKISAWIGTLGPAGFIDDNMSEITLQSVGGGIYVSESQLLVGKFPGAPDDDYFIRSRFESDLLVSDDARNDRTHRVSVDGRIRVEYGTKSATLPVSDTIKTLHVVVHNFKEPWIDANSNGVRDSGESFYDISAYAGNPVRYPVDEIVPITSDQHYGNIWSNTQIETQLDAVKAAFASARIKLVVDDWREEVPVGDLYKQSDPSGAHPHGSKGHFDMGSDNFIVAKVSRDHILIRDNYRSNVNQDVSDDNDVLDIFFTAPFLPRAAGLTAVGLAFFPGFVHTEAIDTRYMNALFISFVAAATDDNYMVTAHEIMHHLTNRGEDGPPPPKYVFFPNSLEGGDGGLSPDGERRIPEATVQQSRAQRNSMTDVGNKLLRN